MVGLCEGWRGWDGEGGVERMGWRGWGGEGGVERVGCCLLVGTAFLMCLSTEALPHKNLGEGDRQTRLVVW